MRRSRLRPWHPILVLAGAATLAALLPAPAPAAPAAPGRYLVTTTADAARQQRTAGRLGVRISQRYRHVLSGYAATLTTAQVRALRSDPTVTSVTPDVIMRTTTTQDKPTWGLDRIDQTATKGDRRYHYDTTGAGVTAYVIDSGVLAGHHQFGGRVHGGYDFVGQDNDPTDCAGHGTHVAGTIGGSSYGVAKEVDIVPLRVFDCEGNGWSSDVIAAMDWVVANRPADRPAVINFSGEGPADTATDDAVTRTVAAGVPVVVAAGNDYGDACATSPARAAAAITVAAVDRTDHEADFSNDGRCVDVYAPGVDVKSAWIDSATATAYLDGTSMATPHVTGFVARYLQGRHTVDPAAVARALTSSATAHVLDRGAGSPNRLLHAYPTRTSAARNLHLSKDDAEKTITVSWSAPSRTWGTAITGYRVTRVRSDGKAVRVDVAGTARKATFGGLSAGKRYTVTVSVRTAYGAGPSASKAITMLAKPGKPPRRYASSGSRRDDIVSVTGRWSKPKSGGAVQRYVVVARRVSDGSTVITTRSSKARGAKIRGLVRDARYVIKVYGRNAAGSGKSDGWSAAVTAR